MSPFFELPDPGPELKRPPRPPNPPWVSAPTGALPGVVAIELVLAANAKVAVAVTRIGAYPDGFEFELWTTASPALEAEDPSLLDSPRMHRMHLRGAHIGPEVLRFGFEFADGARATNLSNPRRGPHTEGPPDSPVMNAAGGGGGGLNWRQNYWAWPLPPPGPLAFVCEWPAFDVPESRVEIDAQLLIDAATRSRRFFDDGPNGGGSVSTVLRAVSHGSSDA